MDSIIIIYFKALGLALNFVGAVILIVGTMKTDRQIGDETTLIPIKKSLVLRKFLLKSRSISLIGLILISVGFLLQFIILFVELYS